MEHCKLQIGCLIIVSYIAFNYYKGCREIPKKHKIKIFDVLLWLGMVSLTFDGITAYTVNRLEQTPEWFNGFAHTIFLGSVDALIFTTFIYMLKLAEKYPKNKKIAMLLYVPFVISIAILIFNIDTLDYCKGTVTNYSMGVSVYSCFVMVGICIAFTLVTFFRGWNNIERHKRASITIYLLVLLGVSIYQFIVPEALLTSIGFTTIVIGIYLNQENPTIQELSDYHQEMVTGLATLVEKRDDNTGGHIRRTSKYVELLAKELRDKGYYRNILTKDYIKNLKMAAPMHDIGKVSVPDAILQKPGKLTDEEFEIMRQHAKNGGKIIKETFKNIENIEYTEMAYQVATYHHEKWNGKGYPTGLKETEIPLCARIMAVADVFDAVSEKRCYRDAMPMEECFHIIEEGSGRDFEPLIAEVFLGMKDKVIKAHDSIK